MRKLLTAALQVVAVLGLDGILDGTGHGVVGTQDGALDQLDLTGSIALEAAGGSTGLLALCPASGRGSRVAAVKGRGVVAGRTIAFCRLKGGGSVLVVARVGRHMAAGVDVRLPQGVAGLVRFAHVAGRRGARRLVKGAVKGACRVGMQ